jgi:hypothetical protein
VSWVNGVQKVFKTPCNINVPQADGQTECVNQELEQYLQVFVNEHQNDWDELLLMVEFQYNNHIHSSTQQTPFFLDLG